MPKLKAAKPFHFLKMTVGGSKPSHGFHKVVEGWRPDHNLSMARKKTRIRFSKKLKLRSAAG
jgi:hypothetical protein